MNTLIICSTIALCIFVVCYYINKFINNKIENNNVVNSLFDDVNTVKEIIDRISKIEFYNEALKQNILTIKNILSKSVEENESIDTSSKFIK